MGNVGRVVAVIGAGPYGLAAAAHLRAAGVEVRVFGRPMEFWQQQMPIGMLLRSAWEASHLSAPGRAYSLDAYEIAQGIRVDQPIPLDSFVHYGIWFQRQIVPELDRRDVMQVEPIDDGFELLLADGERLRADRVVVAAGIGSFAHRPREFAMLPPTLVSHTSEHRDLTRFRGQRLAIIGGGQSALETAALLHEQGTEVEVLVRAGRINWLGGRAWVDQYLKPVRRVLYPPTDVGPPVLNWIVALPEQFRRLPRQLQQRVAARSIRPAGASWLPARLKQVRLSTGAVVERVVTDGQEVRLSLRDGSERRVEHLLLATGYRVDVARYPFLSPELLRGLRRSDGYPLLSAGLESSIPGLHFLGAPAALSFGPVVRFVAGSEFAARALAERVVGAMARPVRLVSASSVIRA